MKIFKITSGGRVTIPVELRHKYNMKPGTKVTFVEKEGRLILKPFNKKYFDELAGALGLKGRMLGSLMGEKGEVLNRVITN